jgi:site-specific recombinase XerD
MRYSARSESGRKCRSTVHPHTLRHGCGYALANAGHDIRALQAWLGHRNHGALHRAGAGQVQELLARSGTRSS